MVLRVVDKPIEGRNIPDYWIRPPQTLSAREGMHRFVWNLHGPDPRGVSFGYPISAVFMNTAKEPAGPWVLPGTSSVKLTVNGKSYTQPLTVRMDPRVKTPMLALVKQHALSVRLVAELKNNADALESLRALRTKVREARATAPPGAAADALAEFDRKAAAIEGTGGGFFGGAGGAPSLGRSGGELGTLYGALQDADVAPTTQLLAAVAEKELAAKTVLVRWRVLRSTDLAALNTALRAAGLPEIH